MKLFLIFDLINWLLLFDFILIDFMSYIKPRSSTKADVETSGSLKLLQLFPQILASFYNFISHSIIDNEVS